MNYRLLLLVITVAASQQVDAMHYFNRMRMTIFGKPSQVSTKPSKISTKPSKISVMTPGDGPGMVEVEKNYDMNHKGLFRKPLSQLQAPKGYIKSTNFLSPESELQFYNKQPGYRGKGPEKIHLFRYNNSGRSGRGTTEYKSKGYQPTLDE